MAVTIKEPNSLQQILNDLECLPIDISSVTLMACVRIKLSDLTIDYLRVTVDSWPHWSCVFVIYEQPFTTEDSAQEVYRAVITYTKSVERLILAIRDENQATHDSLTGGFFLNAAVAKEFYKSLTDGDKQILAPCWGFCMDINSLSGNMIDTYKQLPVGFTFGTIGPADVATVYDHWDVEGKPPYDIFRYNIKHLPNVCVRDSSGLCVAWAITMAWGFVSHLFTLPVFRGRRFARAVLTELSIKYGMHGLRNVAVVKNDNLKSLKLFRNTPGITELNGQAVIVLYTPA